MPDERKILMPEILPDPRVSLRGSPRDRTLFRMRQLIATAAASATVASCTTRAEIEQPTEKPPKDGPSTTKAQEPPKTTPASIEATTTPTKIIEEPPGYMVVDPLPPPSRCASYVSEVKAEAAWLKDGKDWVIDFKLSRPASQPSYTFSKDASASGGKMIKQEVGKGGTYRAIVKPDAGSTGVALLIAVNCGGEASLHVMVYPSGTPISGAKLEIYVSDAY